MHVKRTKSSRDSPCATCTRELFGKDVVGVCPSKAALVITVSRFMLVGTDLDEIADAIEVFVGDIGCKNQKVEM